MASAGDSITAATFADTRSNPTPGHFSTWSDEREKGTNREFRTYFFYENKDTYSWASGRWLDSHFVQLRKFLKNHDPAADLDILNVAIPGNESKDLPAQADRIVAAMNSGHYTNLKYLTLLIGANDACASVRPQTAADHLSLFFEKIAAISQNEKIRILVSGLPPIPLLGTKKVRQHRTLGIFTCEYLRNEVLKLCGNMTTWESEEEYRQKTDEILYFNEAIRTTIRQTEARHPNLEIAFSETFTHYDIPLRFLAFDCFHPNRAGQEEISRFLWEDQHWFKD
jgi:lysophospholipase L1-like esterase